MSIFWDVKDVNLEMQVSVVDLGITVVETLHAPQDEIHEHMLFGDGTEILFGNGTEIIYA